MSALKKAKLKSGPCSWCRGGSMLDIGAGKFRDFDSDLSYGVPVCGGCGGLGITFEGKDFETRREKIMKLRFEYCPTDEKIQATMSNTKRLAALEELINEVKELVRIYGPGAKGCFAQAIVDGTLNEVLAGLRQIARAIAAIRNAPKNDAAKDALRPATIAFFDGRYQDAEKAFLAAIKTYPKSSLPLHDYGVFLIEAKNDYAGAVEFLRRSAELEPKKALHFFQVGKCLAILDKFEEAVTWFEKTKLQADYKQFAESEGEDVDKIIEGINEALISEAQKKHGSSGAQTMIQ